MFRGDSSLHFHNGCQDRKSRMLKVSKFLRYKKLKNSQMKITRRLNRSKKKNFRTKRNKTFSQGLSQKQNIYLTKNFSHPVTYYPLSICYTDEASFKTDKSKTDDSTQEIPNDFKHSTFSCNYYSHSYRWWNTIHSHCIPKHHPIAPMIISLDLI